MGLSAASDRHALVLAVMLVLHFCCCFCWLVVCRGAVGCFCGRPRDCSDLIRAPELLLVVLLLQLLAVLLLVLALAVAVRDARVLFELEAVLLL
jgi:hypothetical protein